MNRRYYDVIVCGGGTSGAIAAIAAARAGASVLIVEVEGFLGGNAVTGLPFLGFYGPEGKQIVGGIAEEIVSDLKEREASPGHILIPRWYSFTPFNPMVLRLVLLEKVIAARGQISFHSRVVEAKNRRGEKETELIVDTVSGKRSVRGRVVIDATGDCVVARLLGAPTVKEQDLQAASLVFTLAGFDRQSFVAFLKANPCEIRGVDEGWTPEFYEQSDYIAFCGLFSLIREENSAGRLNLPREFICFSTSSHPEEVTIVATRVPCDGTEWHSLSTAELSAQLQVIRVIDFLKRRVPGFKQARVAFLAHKIGVRETFRLVGNYVLCEQDIITGARYPDTIALGSWPIDVHLSTGSGQIFRRLEKSYGIPYRCLFSQSVPNLLVTGRCISVDNIAFGSTRTMAQCMATGHCAGVAAVLSLECNGSVADVSIERLKKVLVDQGAILDV